MSPLQAIYQITVKLNQTLSQHITSKNREEIIEEISKLISQRALWMEKIQGESNFSTEEKKLGHEIMELNDRVQKEMENLFNQLKVEMKSTQKQKKTNKKYVNPYADVQLMDGMFLDSKQ